MSLYRFDTEAEKNAAKDRLVKDIAHLTLVKNNPMIFTEPEQWEVSYVGTGLNPCKIDDLLEELGYTRGDIDENGWEGEFWITYTKPNCYPLTLYYEAWDFDIKLRVEED